MAAGLAPGREAGAALHPQAALGLVFVPRCLLQAGSTADLRTLASCSSSCNCCTINVKTWFFCTNMFKPCYQSDVARWDVHKEGMLRHGQTLCMVWCRQRGYGCPAAGACITAWRGSQTSWRHFKDTKDVSGQQQSAAQEQSSEFLAPWLQNH